MFNYVLVGIGFLAIASFLYFMSNAAKKKRRAAIVTEVPASQLPSSGNGHNGNGHNLELTAEAHEFIDNLVAVPARIYDNFTRSVKNDMLPADGVRQIRNKYGNLGRRWYRDGKWLYSVVRLTDGTYVPTQQYMSLSLKNPPERLHRALQQQETATFYRPKDNRGTLAKYGAYLLFAGCALLILFVWGANMMGV